MFIKRVILDGFKSYANRTVVDQFDPEFNAITGLNGSGKSNILDSICFVLGITNLTQVRAKSLQELVYKNGQAGVTKASVTIVFDNTNKDQSPVGYTDQDEITVTRQVVIGGKNKYLINGHNAQKGRVENFFHSVQLNVNNPHFLIMQGRITKVLNMKPREILSMIEEAAGTRMYEAKKAASLQTMERKEQKMAEIERMLAEEIQPTLEKLRNERSAFFEWQKNKMEIDRLNRLVVAYQFTQMEKLLIRSKNEMAEMEQQVQDCEESVAKCAAESEEAEKSITELDAQRTGLLAGDLKAMEEEANDLSKAVVKATEKWKSKKSDLAAEIKSRKATEKGLSAAQDSVPKKQEEIEAAKAECLTMEEGYKAAVEGIEKAEQQKYAVQMGMTADDGGEAKTFAQQIADTKTELNSLASEVEQAKLRVSHQKPLLAKKKAAAKGAEKEHATMVKTLGENEKSVEKIKVTMDGLDFSEEKEAALETEQGQVQADLRKVNDQVDRLGAKLANFEFNYKNPEPGFDRSKVSGLVAELIEVKDKAAMTALEVTAGGKLYNVVVDTETTGKKLLKNGKLKRRVTIIPLNKIKPREIAADKVAKAKGLVGSENANVALSFVGYDAKVDAAMKYVFGGNFICPDMNTAKKVTFNDKIRTKSVTLDGDVMDPSGTLTGGSRPNTAPVLAQLHELKAAKAKQAALEAQFKTISEQLVTLRKSSAKYAQLKEQYDIKQHEIELARSRIEQSSAHQTVAEVEELTASLAESEQLLKDSKEGEKALKQKLKNVETEMSQAKANKEKKLKEAEKAITAAKKLVSEAKVAHKQSEQGVQEKELEKEALFAEIKTIEEQLQGFAGTIEEIEGEVAVLQAKLMEVKDAYESKAAGAKEQRDKVAELEREIESMRKAISRANKRSQSSELALKKLTNKIAGFEKSKKEAAAAVNSLLGQYTWIAKDKEYFGVDGTMYEFDETDPARDPRQYRGRLDALVASQDKLSKTVNMKVMSMFDQTEKSASDLVKKKKIVEADRAKIAQAIEELDEKKNATLAKAFKQVNRDFGSIFSTLLPGTRAELGLTESKQLLDGLTVRVAFGDLWKESLTELSGGQRSLVALSLILSLLLFKPAPLYILDEIDAALDLSHTQNIGQMLKAHFKQSQFIVVSLKEGMFNNANVLFKTAFIDGVSTVRRNAQSRKAIEAKEDRENTGKNKAAAGKGRASGKGRRGKLAASN
jgi:structural maintenance of chromosome 2